MATLDSKRESSTVFELLGAQMWLEHFAPRLSGLRVQLEMDSSPSVWNLQTGYSTAPHLLSMISASRMCCVRNHIDLRVVAILGRVYNTIADALSKGEFVRAEAAALEEFNLPLSLVQ